MTKYDMNRKSRSGMSGSAEGGFRQPGITGDEALVILAQRWRDRLFVNDDIFVINSLKDLATPAEAPLFYLIVLFSHYEWLKDFYEKRGISPESMKATLLDIPLKMDQCRERNGDFIMENDIADWISKHFRGQLFPKSIFRLFVVIRGFWIPSWQPF